VVSQSIDTTTFFEAVCFTNADTGTAVGGDVILRTTNGGETWVRQVSPTAQWLEGVWFGDSHTGVAVGFSGTVIRTTTGGVTGVEEEPIIEGELPKSYALRQNYPNPFNPSTTIEFALPYAGFVTLKVYNLLGEQVATLIAGEHAAGNFKATWDASGLPSGVYFYRLVAGEYVRTKKAVLMR
jgi:hypothetical protein